MPLIGAALDRRPIGHVFLLVNVVGLLCTALLMVPRSPAALSAAIGLVAVGRQVSRRARDAASVHRCRPVLTAGAEGVL